MAVESYPTYLRMLSAGVPRLLSAQREIRWDRHFTTVIKGKTLVIVSLNENGKRMAEAGKALSLRVVGVDPEIENSGLCDEVVRPEEMKAAFVSADFLAICEASVTLIDSEKWGWLPTKAGVISVSSSALPDVGALVERLSSGGLSGAILEICEENVPTADSPLWNAPNLVLIPRVFAGEDR